MNDQIIWIVANSIEFGDYDKTFKRGGFVSFRLDRIEAYKPCANGSGTRVLLMSGEYIEVFMTMQDFHDIIIRNSKMREV